MTQVLIFTICNTEWTLRLEIPEFNCFKSSIFTRAIFRNCRVSWQTPKIFRTLQCHIYMIKNENQQYWSYLVSSLAYRLCVKLPADQSWKTEIDIFYSLAAASISAIWWAFKGVVKCVWTCTFRYWFRL